VPGAAARAARGRAVPAGISCRTAGNRCRAPAGGLPGDAL